MANSMKQRLREQKKKNHEEFRQQLIQDVSEELTRWSKHTQHMMETQTRLYKHTQEQSKQVAEEVKEVSGNLAGIRGKTLQALKGFKWSRTWRFYAFCYLASLLGSVTAVILCGLYWPTIRGLLS